VSITSVKITTKATTTTISCIPTAGSKVRRNVFERAAGGVTITATSTFVTYVKTTSIGQPGSTDIEVVTSTSSAGVQTTLKPATVTSAVTSYATKTTLVTISEAAATVTSFKTSSVAQTVTAAQQTVTFVNSAVETQTITSVLAQSTTTVYSTATLTQASATVTGKLIDLISSHSQANVWAVTPAAATKTTTIKSTSTVYNTSTKTAKDAPACTA